MKVNHKITKQLGGRNMFKEKRSTNFLNKYLLGHQEEEEKEDNSEGIDKKSETEREC